MFLILLFNDIFQMTLQGGGRRGVGGGRSPGTRGPGGGVGAVREGADLSRPWCRPPGRVYGDCCTFPLIR